MLKVHDKFKLIALQIQAISLLERVDTTRDKLVKEIYNNLAEIMKNDTSSK